MTVDIKRIAIVGAGPIGLEAALYAARLGHDVHVYERGTAAANVLAWGHVKLFSPFGMNASPWGRKALAGRPDGGPLPADDALLSGRQFTEQYLLPLSRLPILAGRIHEHVEVQSIGRTRHWKGEAIGRPERADDPFQLLLQCEAGERLEPADVVLDCSGTYGNHNWAGGGGIPAIGERQSLEGSDYLLPDVCGRDRARFAGKKTLVLGGGYSAATAVVDLAMLAVEESETKVVWVTRRGSPPLRGGNLDTERQATGSPPIAPIESDSLIERAALTAAANQLALSSDGPVDWRPGQLLRQVARASSHCDGRLRVRLESWGGEDAAPASGALTVDRIIANVGYRPDRTLYEELQVHECYASSGPMKLAAALLGEASTDCTAQASHGPDVLRNPEPNLFILGSKSYGRDSRFLLRIGLQQIVDAFSLMDARRAMP